VRRRRCSLLIFLHSDGTGNVDVRGPARAITAELRRLIERYATDLVAAALADPLVGYAHQRMTQPPPFCGCAGRHLHGRDPR
jgi:hypothetical protein